MPLTILAVDDDATNLMVIESLVGTLGWNVLRAQDGKEALEEAQQVPSPWP